MENSSHIQLVRAGTSDVEKFIELEKTVNGLKTYSAMTNYDEALKEITHNFVYFIYAGEQLVGSLMYEHKEDGHVYVSGLVVAPQFQGKGVARRAMELALEKIGKVRRVDLVVHPDNEKAINLYTSFGFSIESTKENYFGDGEPRLVMSLLS